MACPAVLTGERFLSATLVHIDCQAQAIGAYGFGGLASPGSPVSIALGSVLAIFVGIFGLRLAMGYPIAGRDVVSDMLRVGIALTLASSWPAWRIVGYDLVIHGPGQFATAIGLASQLPGFDGDFLGRLQLIDDGLAALNMWGSGRLGAAQGDWFQLGLARDIFLVCTIGTIGGIRLLAGILLAVAPLVALTLLFTGTRSIFVGWAKGLGFILIASTATIVILAAEMALLLPWLQDAAAKRAADQQTLDAPLEVVSLALAFGIATVIAILVIAWISFHPSSPLTRVTNRVSTDFRASRLHSADQSNDRDVASETQSNASRVSMAVNQRLLREQFAHEGRSGRASEGQGDLASAQLTQSQSVREPLGSSFRRNTRRTSAIANKRDSAR